VSLRESSRRPTGAYLTQVAEHLPERPIRERWVQWVLRVNVTSHPYTAWAAQQIVEALRGCRKLVVASGVVD
jgi:hypothetical protein